MPRETCSPKHVSESSLAPLVRLREKRSVFHLSVFSPLPVGGQTWPWPPEEPETSNFKAPWLPLRVGTLHWLGQRTLSPLPKGTPSPDVAPPGSGLGRGSREQGRDGNVDANTSVLQGVTQGQLEDKWIQNPGPSNSSFHSKWEGEKPNYSLLKETHRNNDGVFLI